MNAHRILIPLAVFAATAAAQDSLPARLSLGEAARLAADRGASSRVARLRADEANARVELRKADLLPSVSAIASQSGRTFNTASFGIEFPTAPGQKPFFDPNGQVEGPVNLLDVRGRVSQTLYDPAARERVRAAKATATAITAEAAAVSQQAAAQASIAYVRALRAAAQVDARTQDSTLAAELLRIARDQLEAGVGIALDVTRAQSQLAGLRAQLIASRTERDRAMLDLLRALGASLDAHVTLTDSLSGDTFGAVDERAAIATALGSRADIRAAQEQINASRQAISSIKAERLPTVGAFADQGLIGKNPAHLLPTYDYGIQLSFNVFDGRRREARMAEQTAASREIELRLKDLEEDVAHQVRGAILEITSAREQVDAARERVRLGEQEVSQARDRFAAGVAGNADVVTASLGLTTARTQLVDALAAYLAARVGLARAQGTLTSLR